ncbi:hypothetical protein AMECASPLE_030123 [Ameca splendens]|uniref:Uncharacterized protein n=1 Tax=Ameca splendens TaxID=208324 RepID=A0ABV0Y5X5_9TELE
MASHLMVNQNSKHKIKLWLSMSFPDVIQQDAVIDAPSMIILEHSSFPTQLGPNIEKAEENVTASQQKLQELKTLQEFIQKCDFHLSSKIRFHRYKNLKMMHPDL